MQYPKGVFEEYYGGVIGVEIGKNKIGMSLGALTHHIKSSSASGVPDKARLWQWIKHSCSPTSLLHAIKSYLGFNMLMGKHRFPLTFTSKLRLLRELMGELHSSRGGVLKKAM